MYETKKYNNQFIFEEQINKGELQDKKYILGEDKFPLEDKQMGILNKKIDIILNQDSTKFISNSRLTDGSTLFIRIGIKQNPKTSFLDSMARLKGISVTKLVKDIIENINF